MVQIPNPNQVLDELYISSSTTSNPPTMRLVPSYCVDFRQNWTSCQGLTNLVYRSNILSDFPSSSCGRRVLTIEWFPLPIHAGKSFKVCATPKVTLSSYGNAWLGQEGCIVIEVMTVQLTWGGFFHQYYDTDFMTSAFIGCTKTWNVTVQNMNMDNSGPNYPVLLYLESISLGAKDVVHEKENFIFSWTPSFDMAGRSLEMCFSAIDVFAILGKPRSKLCKGGPKSLQSCTTDFDCPYGVCQDACIRIQVQKCQYCIQTATTLELIADFVQPRTDWLRLWALNSYQGKTDATANIVGIQFIPQVYPQTRIDDPGYIVPTAYDQGRVLSYGVLHQISHDEPIEDVAVRYGA
eukprot:766710-Hanusia_phi.AAC.5